MKYLVRYYNHSHVFTLGSYISKKAAQTKWFEATSRGYEAWIENMSGERV